MHNRNDKKLNKIERKTIPYQKLYYALMEYKDYFALFIYGANEYKISEDPEKFGPLETNMKFRREYDKYRMFLSKNLQKMVIKGPTCGTLLPDWG